MNITNPMPTSPEFPEQTETHQPARVRLEYDVAVGEQLFKVQLPFVMGVMADLSGMPTKPLPDVAQRPFVEFDLANLDSQMKNIEPRVAFQVENVLSAEEPLEVELTFKSMNDFSPAAIATRVATLQQLLKDRSTLAELPANIAAWSDAMRRITHPAAVEAVRTANSTAAVIADIDRKLSAQIHLILHHPDFQALERAWRGLHYLVSQSPTDALLKIRVIDLSKKDLHRSLRRFKGSQREQGPIFKHIHDELENAYGEPLGCLIGDYEFDHSPQDVELLCEIARIAAEAHCPFISSAAPQLLHMSSWKGLAGLGDPTLLFSDPAYGAWRLLRESEDSNYLCLTLPRFLARQVYGGQSNPVSGFHFEEPLQHDTCTWANAAYLLAVNINRAFRQSGWFAAIDSINGGLTGNLPADHFPSADGGTTLRTTEVTLHEKQALALQKAGLLPLMACQDSNRAFFSQPQSLNKSPTYENPETDALVKLWTRLHFRLTCSRFVHYLRCIARSRVGGFFQAADIENCLNQWISQYVVDAGDEAHPSVFKPLGGAQVEVLEVDGEPGTYRLKLLLRPAYQFEWQAKSIRLLSKLIIGHPGRRSS